MEIKIELKSFEQKIINDFEESVQKVFKKLNDNEKMDLKHKIMGLKIRLDTVESDIKTLTSVLNELNQPKPVEEKPVEQKPVQEIEEIEL
jgi:adenosine deaminase